MERSLARNRSLGYNVQTTVHAQAECPRPGGGSKDELHNLAFGSLFILRTLPHIHLRRRRCKGVAGHGWASLGQGG